MWRHNIISTWPMIVHLIARVDVCACVTTQVVLSEEPRQSQLLSSCPYNSAVNQHGRHAMQCAMSWVNRSIDRLLVPRTRPFDLSRRPYTAGRTGRISSSTDRTYAASVYGIVIRFYVTVRSYTISRCAWVASVLHYYSPYYSFIWCRWVVETLSCACGRSIVMATNDCV